MAIDSFGSLAPDTRKGEKNGGFLHLGSSVRRIPYRGVEQFWHLWNMEPDQRKESDDQDSEWVLFTNVDEKTFTRDFFNFPDKTLARTWNAFDKFQNLLLVTMTESTPHAIASQTFDEVLTDILTEMGLKRMLVHFGRSPRKGEEGAKAPDASYMPKRPPRGWSKDWPSMVLEVAYSESRKKLMSDV